MNGMCCNYCNRSAQQPIWWTEN